MKFQRRSTEEEYKRDPKINKQDIEQLQQWVEKQPHMPPIEGKYEYWYFLGYFCGHFYES